jgi:hypothetical protein
MQLTLHLLQYVRHFFHKQKSFEFRTESVKFNKAAIYHLFMQYSRLHCNANGGEGIVGSSQCLCWRSVLQVGSSQCLLSRGVDGLLLAGSIKYLAAAVCCIALSLSPHQNMTACSNMKYPPTLGHTKYIYIQSTTVDVPSSELGFPHPLSP